MTLRVLIAAVATLLAQPLLAQPLQGQDRPLTVTAPWEIASLGPSVAGFAFQRVGAAETLVEVDEAGALVPGLAEAWESAEDGLVWRFRRREGVAFHDGALLDAAAASLRRALPLSLPGVLVNAPVEAIEAEGREVVVRLADPFAALPALLTHSSTLILAPASFGAGGEVEAVIGTGSYEIEDLSPPQSMRLAPPSCTTSCGRGASTPAPARWARTSPRAAWRSWRCRGARSSHLGETAVVEVTGLRKPCRQLDGHRAGLMAAVLDRDERGGLVRKAGVMGVVRASGTVRAGDPVRVSLPAGPHRRLEPV